MRARLILLASLVVPLLALSLAGCTGGESNPENSYTLVGTWVNSAYNGHGGGPPGKVEITASSIALYDNDTDPTPLRTATFTLAENWTSGGAHYFKGITVVGSNTAYFLVRVENHNNTLESNSTSTSYPAVIDPAGSQYGIFARQ